MKTRSDITSDRRGRIRPEILRSLEWWRTRPTPARVGRITECISCRRCSGRSAQKCRLKKMIRSIWERLCIETERPMNDMEKLARTTLAGINPNLTVMKFETFDDQIADRFSTDRMMSRLSTLFGALALLLATDWLIRRDRVFRCAADSGDWYPHGARCRTQRSDCDGDAGGNDSSRRSGWRSESLLRCSACDL